MHDITHSRYQGVRVLIAEDSSINRRLASLLLEMMGCTVDAVASGTQAVEAFRRRSYDLVLMNCHMPGVDGTTATTLIRQFEAADGRHTPIIGITAFALPTDRAYCLRRGMDDCLLKPLRRETLDAVLSRWLTARSMTG